MTPDAAPERPLRVLLVDDEEAYARVLAKRLERRGFEVATAFSGAEGVRMVKRGTYDVAVLDLKMEDMDGLEALKIFKMMEPSMAVIMLTGHGSEVAAREGLALGAFDYLMKPCGLDQLVFRIRHAVNARGESVG